MLDPEWIAQNHSRFDVFHIHFGFDAISTDVLGEVIDELARYGKPWFTPCTTCAIRINPTRVHTTSSWTSWSAPPTS